MAFPRPVPPPVTSATCPSSRPAREDLRLSGPAVHPAPIIWFRTALSRLRAADICCPSPLPFRVWSVSRRPLVTVPALTLGDLLLWHWSLAAHHEVLALASGLSLPPLLVASMWLGGADRRAPGGPRRPGAPEPASRAPRRPREHGRRRRAGRHRHDRRGEHAPMAGRPPGPPTPPTHLQRDPRRPGRLRSPWPPPTASDPLARSPLEGNLRQRRERAAATQTRTPGRKGARSPSAIVVAGCIAVGRRCVDLQTRPHRQHLPPPRPLRGPAHPHSEEGSGTVLLAVLRLHPEPHPLLPRTGNRPPAVQEAVGPQRRRPARVPAGHLRRPHLPAGRQRRTDRRRQPHRPHAVDPPARRAVRHRVPRSPRTPSTSRS